MAKYNEPTRKQKQTLAILSADIGISTAKAMQMAGYSKSYSRQPQNLTKSPVFADLAQKFLPDSKLIAVAQQGLEATKTTRYKGKTFKDPDYYARHQYLDTALRIRGLAQSTDTPIGDINIQVINYKDSPTSKDPINIGDNGEMPPARGQEFK